MCSEKTATSVFLHNSLEKVTNEISGKIANEMLILTPM